MAPFVKHVKPYQHVAETHMGHLPMQVSGMGGCLDRIFETLDIEMGGMLTVVSPVAYKQGQYPGASG